MTDDGRRDAVIRDWILAEAPGHAPSRIRDLIRDQVADTRQERPTIAFPIQARSLAWAAVVAALLVLAVLTGVLIGSPRPSVAPSETPSPSPSPSAAPAGSPVPTPRGSVVAAGLFTPSQLSPQVALTLPLGWTLEDDQRDAVALIRPNAGHMVQGDGLVYFDAIRIYARPTAAQPDGTLGGVPGVGSTAEEVATWLSQRPQLTATKPTKTLLAGRTAWQLDFELSSNAGDLCGIPCAALLDGPDRSAQYAFGIEGDWRVRAFLLEAPDGSTVMVTIEDTDGVGFEAEVAAAQPIVDSLVFVPPVQPSPSVPASG